jgi:transposase
MAERIAELEAAMAELQAKLAGRDAEIKALRDRIAHLEAELNRNSENSSKPPSADPLKPRQSRSERRAAARAAGRKQGKQPGAPGANLARRIPDETINHAPVCCRSCGNDLAGAEVVGEVRRQVLEIPEIRVHVTDHVAERRRCACGHETVACFPPEARAPVCWGPEVRALAIYLMDRQHLPLQRCAELLGELLDAQVSTGWLCAVQLEAAGKLSGFITTLKDRLGEAPVVHADETGTRVGLTKHWVHTLATNLLTLLVVHPKRGVEALEDIGILGDYAGTVVHDGWAPYEVFAGASHAQCGAHLVRHLAAVGKTEAFATWCAEMTEILLAAKKASEAAAGEGRAKVRRSIAAGLRRRYQSCLDDAFTLLPPGPLPRRRHEGGWDVHQRAAFNLATRLREDDDQVLRLLDDTRVRFDNNIAERALRMVKLHDKISGTFRSEEGATAFVTVRSYLQTVALNGHNRLNALHQLFTTGPWLPPLAAGT